MKNVIVTSYRLSAIGWFTGVLSEIHKAIYGEPINWHYEISRFECTRARRPLPMGWNTVWEANPLTLANRGFDKILVVKRPLKDIIKACCWYDFQKSYITLINECSPSAQKGRSFRDYIGSLKRNYFKLYDVKCDNHEKIYQINIEDLNINPIENFEAICRFLEFDMEKYPIIVPVKVQKEWEVYAGYKLPKELNSRLKMIKAAKIRSKAADLIDEQMKLQHKILEEQKKQWENIGDIIKDAKQKSKTQVEKEEI